MTRQHQNQSFDQKKGSADQCVTGQAKNVPAGESVRGSMASSGNMSSTGSKSSTASNSSSGSVSYGNTGERTDYESPQASTRDQKSSRSGSKQDRS